MHCKGQLNLLNSQSSWLYFRGFSDEFSGKSATFPPPSRDTIECMSRAKPILFFAVVAAAALFFVLRKPVSAEVNVGDPAPEFAIKDDMGKELKLSDYRGNVVFLNFWYTTCAPCIK
jgi:AhpC/TSA family